MPYSAAVIGGSGYTGGELLRLLAGHPEIDVGVVMAHTNAGGSIAEHFPALAGGYPEMRFAATDPAAAAGADVVFLALPHGESQRLAADLVDRAPHVVDLAADFRLPAAVYEEWYGETHAAPQLIDRFQFGMVELFRKELTSARHVAVPGCYPTAASLALAPLLADGAVEPTGIVVDAASGISGAGRSPKVQTLFSEAGEQYSAYSLLNHRHTAEIEMALSHVGERAVTVLFTPHLAPMTRGILATCYARPAVAGLTTEALLARYREYYADDPCVIVVDEPSGTRATYGSNAVHVTVRFDPRTHTVLAIAAEDNLVKGASGQALQNANLLLGLPETMGLSLVGVAP
jgi:N-acetyl-gamma-glutamyl-phosphate reductase